MQVLDLRPGERVLLVGIGTGADLPLLPEGICGAGLDLSPALLARAQAKLPLPERDVTLILGDALTLPLGARQFDAVVLHLVLSVVPDGAAVQRPVGAVYLALWIGWWLLIAVGRQRGMASAYDRSQRLIYTLGIVALVGLVVVPPWEYAHFPGPIPRDGPWAWIGLALFATGIVLQAAAFRALRGLYTSRLGMQPGHRLITSGAYRWVRHPGYLSNLLCLMGIGLALSSLVGLGLALLVVPLIVQRIEREEEMLAAEFRQEYECYRQQVQWRLISHAF